MAFIATLASGSSGNAAILSDGNTNILIDAGISCRRIKTALSEFDIPLCDIDAVLVTHEHTDHIKGLEVLCRSQRCPVYATDGTAWGMERKLPGFDGDVRLIRAGDNFEVGFIGITPIATPHDAAESVCYLFSLDGHSVLYATDIGHITPDIAAAAKASECVFLESNHDIYSLLRGSYPEMLKTRILSARGHLSNDDCADMVREAAESGTRRFTLCHLSRENNTPKLAADASMSALRTVGAEGVTLEVAPADRACAPYIFEC